MDYLKKINFFFEITLLLIFIQLKITMLILHIKYIPRCMCVHIFNFVNSTYLIKQ